MKDFLKKWKYAIDMAGFSLVVLLVWTFMAFAFFKAAPFTVIGGTIFIVGSIIYTVGDCIRMDKEMFALKEKIREQINKHDNNGEDN